MENAHVWRLPDQTIQAGFLVVCESLTKTSMRRLHFSFLSFAFSHVQVESSTRNLKLPTVMCTSKGSREACWRCEIPRQQVYGLPWFACAACEPNPCSVASWPKHAAHRNWNCQFGAFEWVQIYFQKTGVVIQKASYVRCGHFHVSIIDGLDKLVRSNYRWIWND